MFSSLLKRTRTRIFLSYSSRDVALANTLRADFSSSRVDVYQYTIEMDGGDLIAEKLKAAIAEVDCFVQLLSDASLASEWVSRELRWAQETGARIIHVRIGECKIPPEYQDRNIIDLVDSATSQSNRRKLIRQLKPKLSNSQRVAGSSVPLCCAFGAYALFKPLPPCPLRINETISAILNSRPMTKDGGRVAATVDPNGGIRPIGTLTRTTEWLAQQITTTVPDEACIATVDITPLPFTLTIVFEPQTLIPPDGEEVTLSIVGEAERTSKVSGGKVEFYDLPATLDGKRFELRFSSSSAYELLTGAPLHATSEPVPVDAAVNCATAAAASLLTSTSAEVRAPETITQSGNARFGISARLAVNGLCPLPVRTNATLVLGSHRYPVPLGVQGLQTPTNRFEVAPGATVSVSGVADVPPAVACRDQPGKQLEFSVAHAIDAESSDTTVLAVPVSWQRPKCPVCWINRHGTRKLATSARPPEGCREMKDADIIGTYQGDHPDCLGVRQCDRE